MMSASSRVKRTNCWVHTNKHNVHHTSYNNPSHEKNSIILPLDIPFVNCSCSMHLGISIGALKKHLSQSRSWTYSRLAVMKQVEKIRRQEGIIHRDEVCEYKLTESEIDEMLSAVNGASNDFANRLEEYYNLQRHTVVFCCLIMFQLSNQEIKALIDLEEPTIKKKKQRLKKKFFKPPYKEILEDFLIDFQDNNIGK